MAQRFRVLNAGLPTDWDASSTINWSTTSGGLGGASAPGSSDDVIFDGNSGGGVVTLTADQAVKSITMGAFTNGEVVLNGHTLTDQTFSASGTAVRALTLDTGHIICTATGLAFDISTATNLTVTPGTSVITLSGAGAQFNGGNKTYYKVEYTGGGQGVFFDTVSHILNDLKYTGAATKTAELFLFIATAQITIDGQLYCRGAAANQRVWMAPSNSGGSVHISAGSTNIENSEVMDIIGSGAASWDLSAATSVGDCGGNSGLTFCPSTDQHWTSASSGAWSDITKWTSRVPLAHDHVKMDKAFGTSQTVTTDMRHLGADIDWTGATWTTGLTWAFSNAINNFGSLTLIAGLTLSTAQNFGFRGRTGPCTIDTKGVTWIHRSIFTAPSSTYNLAANAAINNRIDVNAGTFSANGHDLSATVLFGASTTAFGQGYFDPGSGTTTLTASGGAGDCLSFTNTIVLPHTGTIKFTDTSNSSLSISAGGNTFRKLWLNRAASTGDINWKNSVYVMNVLDGGTAAHAHKPTAGITFTYDEWHITGTAGNVVQITCASAYNLVAARGGTVSVDYLNIDHANVPAGQKFYVGTHSTDSGNNVNVTFTAAPASVPSRSFFI